MVIYPGTSGRVIVTVLSTIGMLFGIGDRCVSADDLPAASEEVQERGFAVTPKVMQPTLPTLPSATPPTQIPKAAIPSVPKTTDEAKRVTFSRGEAQWISWDYLRTNHPATVAALLGSVKSGALSASAVEGLAHPADLQAMLNHLNASPASPTASKFPLATVAAPSLYASLPMRCTPENIDFGAMLVGQTVSSRIRVIAPEAGNLNVVIPDGAFRIREVISHTGTYRMQDVTIPLPNGGTRQTIMSVPVVDQQITIAPWAIAVKAGQDVEIVVDVTTQRTIKLGEHSSVVQISHSDGRSTSVPIHAVLTGLMYGIGIRLDGLFYVLPGNDLLIPFEWYNDGEPSSATLTLDNLPTGFTVVTPPPPSGTLGKGQSQKSSLVINSGTYIAPGSLLTVPFRVTNGPTHLTYAVQIVVVRTWVHQSFGGQAFFDDGERVDVTGFLEIRRDGWYLYSGNITSTGTGKGFGISFDSIYRYTVQIVVDSFGPYAKGSFGHGSLGHASSTEDSWTQSGMSNQIQTDFINAARSMSLIEPMIRVTRSTF
jgi:hypothetical protein